LALPLCNVMRAAVIARNETDSTQLAPAGEAIGPGGTTSQATVEPGKTGPAAKRRARSRADYDPADRDLLVNLVDKYRTRNPDFSRMMKAALRALVRRESIPAPVMAGVRKALPKAPGAGSRSDRADLLCDFAESWRSLPAEQFVRAVLSLARATGFYDASPRRGTVVIAADEVKGMLRADPEAKIDGLIVAVLRAHGVDLDVTSLFGHRQKAERRRDTAG